MAEDEQEAAPDVAASRPKGPAPSFEGDAAAIGAAMALVLGLVGLFLSTAGRHPVGLVASLGLLAVAVALLATELGRRRGRARQAAGRGLVVGVALAAAILAGLVVQARSVGPGGSPTVAVDRSVDVVWADGDDLVALDHLTVAPLGDDGALADADPGMGGSPTLASGTVAVITTDGPHVLARGRDGGVVWETTTVVDGAPAQRVEVGAVPSDGSAALRVCRDDRCDLVGLDPTGAERWRQPADTTLLGEGPVVVDDERGDSPLREAPLRLVVVDRSSAPDAVAEEVRVSTGARTEIGAGGTPTVVDSIVAIVRRGDDGCEVGLVDAFGTGGRDVPLPCPDGPLGAGTVAGSVVIFTSTNQYVAVDVAEGSVATRAIGDGQVAGVAGGRVVIRADGEVRLLDPIADEVVARHVGWSVEAVGRDGLVLGRTRQSDNPFAAERLVEVAVVDPGTGEICARVRVEAPGIDRASPLPGCRAYVAPDDAPALLVSPG